jgi:uncharacterized membrane protein
MRTQALLRYVVMDLTNPRGRYEILVGVFTIAFAAGALALLFALSSGTGKMIDASFKKARPIMGVLVVQPRSEAFTPEQIASLTTLVQQEPRIEALSLVAEKRGGGQSFDDWFWVWKTANADEDSERILDVSINAVKDNDPMLDPEFGVFYPQGGPFAKLDNWRLGVIVNERFLGEEGLGYSADEIKAFAQRQKPLSIELEPANNIGPQSVNIKPGNITIPVTGIVDIEHPLYPDLFFSHDVVEAYYNTGSWEPSYILQFLDVEGKHLLPYQWQNLDNGNILLTHQETGETTELAGNEFFQLSPKAEHQSTAQYAKALLWIRDYRKTQEGESLQKSIQEQYGKLRVRSPDVTLTQALRRINDMIALFVQIVAIILMVLCASTIIFFGMGHVRRKMADLGLLRACGMSAVSAGQLFIIQILVLSLVAIFVGQLLATLAAIPIEPIIDKMLNQQCSTSEVLKCQLEAFTLQISVKDLLLTSMGVLIASLVGAIVPTIMAMRVDPMDQLRTQL